METALVDFIGSTSGWSAYGLVFGVLLLCGLGLPLPEDVVLITGGYLTSTGDARLGMMMVISYLGILGGDSFVFTLGRKLGDGLSRFFLFRRLLAPKKRKKVEALFARYGEKIVFLARFMPGLRALIFFVAGTAKMRYRKFILFDGVAALVSAPLFVFLGFYFGENIEYVIHQVRRGQTWALVVVGSVVAVYIVYKLIRYRQSQKNGNGKPGAATPAAPTGEASDATGRPAA